MVFIFKINAVFTDNQERIEGVLFDTDILLYEYRTELCTQHVSACPICHQVRPQEYVRSQMNGHTPHLTSVILTVLSQYNKLQLYSYTRISF